MVSKWTSFPQLKRNRFEIKIELQESNCDLSLDSFLQRKKYFALKHLAIVR